MPLKAFQEPPGPIRSDFIRVTNCLIQRLLLSSTLQRSRISSRVDLDVSVRSMKDSILMETSIPHFLVYFPTSRRDSMRTAVSLLFFSVRHFLLLLYIFLHIFFSMRYSRRQICSIHRFPSGCLAIYARSAEETMFVFLSMT